MMEILEDTTSRRDRLSPDLDLRDEYARSSHHRWWFGAILALDTLAILAFLAWVVIPKLT
ncbi:MAG TPA: hypothetical protein VMR89_00585 [Actinomycetota bacterium]|nr:hypothetical protein [Actinomycetota bacterium]